MAAPTIAAAAVVNAAAPTQRRWSMRPRLRLQRSVTLGIGTRFDFNEHQAARRPLLRGERDKHLFLSPSVPDWLVVNQSGAAILGLCDGTRSITQIAAALGVQGDDLLDDIQHLLVQAGSHSLFAGIVGETESTVRSTNSCSGPAFSLPLHTVHLQLTNKCNYRCAYCYARSGTQVDPMLPLEVLTKVVDEVTSLSPNCRYELSGGEPLLYPHIFELSEYIKSKGSPMSLLTNGSLINEKNYQRIAALYDFVKISLDGSNPLVNDRTRGRGTYKKARRAIDLLRSCGASISVSMTVTHDNIDNVPAMAHEFGNILKFAPTFAAGRGNGKDELCITGEEYYYALASVAGVNPLSSPPSRRESEFFGGGSSDRAGGGARTGRHRQREWPSAGQISMCISSDRWTEQSAGLHRKWNQSIEVGA